MEKIKFDKKEIEKIFIKAERILFNKKNVIEIIFNDFDHKTFDANNKVLLKSVSQKAIVYCLWSGTSIEKVSQKYIGHSSSKYSRTRIRSHLAYKSVKTSAKLDNIKEELKLKNCIGISFLIIEPEYMRRSLEEWLIEKYSQILSWNNGKH